MLCVRPMGLCIIQFIVYISLIQGTDYHALYIYNSVCATAACINSSVLHIYIQLIWSKEITIPVPSLIGDFILTSSYVLLRILIWLVIGNYLYQAKV